MKIALAVVISASASRRAGAEQDQKHQRGLEKIVVERREELASRTSGAKRLDSIRGGGMQFDYGKVPSPA